MFVRKRWSTARELVKGFRQSTGAQPERVVLLGAVWDREMGHFSRHWSLVGVRKGILYVRPRSAAAAQELHLRGPEIIRCLNKHFSRAWIRAVKTSVR